ncbi:hypothetical protein Tco_0746090 [Tanacetum coccineum]
MLLMNAHENGVVLDEEQLFFLAGEQVSNFDEDVDDLALNVDHVFKTDQCDAFNSDVDEAPTTQTMFMVNLSSEDPIYDEARPSYDSNTPFEVKDHDTFVDHMDEYHEVHEIMWKTTKNMLYKLPGPVMNIEDLSKALQEANLHTDVGNFIPPLLRSYDVDFPVLLSAHFKESNPIRRIIQEAYAVSKDFEELKTIA